MYTCVCVILVTYVHLCVCYTGYICTPVCVLYWLLISRCYVVAMYFICHNALTASHNGLTTKRLWQHEKLMEKWKYQSKSSEALFTPLLHGVSAL